MADITLSGRCNCSAVKFDAAVQSLDVGMCHCSICRRGNGGMPFAGLYGKVTLKEDGGLKWIRRSPWSERGFCAECGSSLFWREPENVQGMWGIAAGAIDDQRGFKVTQHIFIDDKPAFYDFADDAPRSTGAEFTAHMLKDMAKEHGPEFLEQAISQIREQSGDEFADAVSKAATAF